MPEFTGTKDVRAYLRILWRWKVIFLILVIAGPLAAYLLERGKPKTYRSSALVGISQATVDTSLLNGASGGFSTTNVTAIAQLVTTSPVAGVAAGLLHPPADPRQIVAEVSATGDPVTNFLTISAVDRSPARAAAIANAFARAISLNRQHAAVTEINNAIIAVQAQLSKLRSTDPTRGQLGQQLSQLRAALATQGSDAQVLQAATPNASPVGPNVRRAMELGLLIGLLLAFGAITLAESGDRRLRTPEDLEGMTGLPLLSAIPRSAFSGELDTGAVDDEAFQRLRTSLMYFNVERRLASVIVTSAGAQDGKTTVATRLALAAAGAGMRTILVDADLRRAQVSARLGLEPPLGLGAVIAGQLPLDAALTEYPMHGPGAEPLMVLPAGPPPPNPSALLSSDEMEGIIRDLEGRSDLVIVDTPAALAVSDPLPLMRLVTGVVLVARMNRSSRETIGRLRKMVDSAQGTMVGVVATGVGSSAGYASYSGGYYSAEPGTRKRRRARVGRRRRSERGSGIVINPADGQMIGSRQPD